jgi:hypothetical protein
MNYGVRGAQVSVIIHSAVFALLIALNSSFVSVNKPVVIDFNIADSIDAQREIQSEPPAPKTKSVARSLKPEAAQHKTKTTITDKAVDTDRKPITESQALVPYTQPNHAKGNDTGSANTAATSKADISSMDKKGRDINSGDYGDRAKTKYLKEHFTYIRDLIIRILT